METMDFVIIGMAVLLALIGLFRGGAKMFFGLFMLIIIMVGAAFISSAICPLFLKSEQDDGSVNYTGAATVLMEPLGGVLPSDGDFGALLDKEVTRGPDGELYIEGENLADVISENVPYVGSGVAPFVVAASHAGETLRTSISYLLTQYIYETVLWVILVIILAIIRNILRKKLYVYLDAHPGPSKIDRVIGLVLNLAILLVLLWGVGVLMAHFDDGANWANSANTFMTSGTIAEPLMTFNPFLKLIG